MRGAKRFFLFLFLNFNSLQSLRLARDNAQLYSDQDLMLETPSIHSILNRDYIKVQIDVQSKDELLDQAIGMLKEHPAVRSFEAIEHDIRAREAQLSTGVGHAVAMPHARSNAVSETILGLVTTKEGVPYESIDDKPVQIIFVLVSDAGSVSPHIKILSRLSRLVNNSQVREDLIKAASVEEVIEIIHASEAAMV